MKQSRIDSAIEVSVNMLIGMVLAMFTQVVWFGAIGKQLSMGEHFSTVLVFTVVSFIRSFAIRRIFEGKPVYKTLKEWIRNDNRTD